MHHRRYLIVVLSLAALAITSISDMAFAQRCKYKTDGTGNCLSPAFYACQKNWTACAKKCEAGKPTKDAKGISACKDVCEVKYAAQCGD